MKNKTKIVKKVINLSKKLLAIIVVCCMVLNTTLSFANVNELESAKESLFTVEESTKTLETKENCKETLSKETTEVEVGNSTKEELPTLKDDHNDEEKKHEETANGEENLEINCDDNEETVAKKAYQEEPEEDTKTSENISEQTLEEMEIELEENEKVVEETDETIELFESKENDKNLIIEKEIEIKEVNIASQSEAESEFANTIDNEKQLLNDTLINDNNADKMSVDVSNISDAFGIATNELSLSVLEQEKQNNEIKEVEKNIVLEDNENVVKRITYDIKIMHNGSVVEPLDGKEVDINFAIKNIPQGAENIKIYHHIDGKAQKIAEKMLHKENDNVESNSMLFSANADLNDAITINAKISSFSFFTVDFTYGTKTYKMQGNTTMLVKDILANIGISETITNVIAYQDDKFVNIAAGNDVKNSDGTNTLFKVYNDGDWKLESKNAFSSTHGIVVKTDSGAEYKIKVTDSTPTPLTFKALTANSTITFGWDKGSNIKYSIDGCSTWNNYSTGNSITLTNIGDTVSFKGKDVVTYSYADKHFSMTGSIEASGDVTSLTNETGGDVALSKECYQYMFNGCTSLTRAPSLPSTTLAESCYVNMFAGCSNLIGAPSLPATTLVTSCYKSMFYGCTNLTTVPSLPATTLEKNCYNSMFNGCTKLTTAPSLPATTLAENCYQNMFNGCTSLAKAPELPATEMAKLCYNSMFYRCTSLKTAPSLPATKLAESCYETMFSDCTEFTSAPVLPATNLEKSCYKSMFQRCTKMTSAPSLPATTLAENCYQNMFFGCTSLTKATKLPATTLQKDCYRQMFYNCSSLNVYKSAQASTALIFDTSSMSGDLSSYANMMFQGIGTSGDSEATPVAGGK